MYNAKTLIEYENKLVVLQTTDETEIIGKVILVTFADDTDDGIENIDIETDTGDIVCVETGDIKNIQIA